jgi:hypothetical protein
VKTTGRHRGVNRGAFEALREAVVALAELDAEGDEAEAEAGRREVLDAAGDAAASAAGASAAWPALDEALRELERATVRGAAVAAARRVRAAIERYPVAPSLLDRLVAEEGTSEVRAAIDRALSEDAPTWARFELGRFDLTIEREWGAVTIEHVEDPTATGVQWVSLGELVAALRPG